MIWDVMVWSVFDVSCFPPGPWLTLVILTWLHFILFWNSCMPVSLLRPVRDSNPGPFSYRTNALPTEVTGRPMYHLTYCFNVHHYLLPDQIVVIFPWFSIGIAIHCEIFLEVYAETFLTGEMCNTCEKNMQPESGLGLQPGVSRFQDECSIDWATWAPYIPSHRMG